MTDMEKISIIIPSYNSETSIERCIRSAALQSYPEKEIIAVDDASTDSTPKILRKLEKEIPSLRVILREKNGGVSAARNTGMEAAAGRWLVTLDGDDYMEPGMLEALYAAQVPAEGMPAQLSICGMNLVYPDRTEVIEAPAAKKRYAAVFLTQYMCTLWDKHLLTTHANKLYDLELIRKEGLRYREDLRINEDIDFVFRYLALCRNIAMTKGAYMNYVQHGAGESNITVYRENGLSSSLAVLEDFQKIEDLSETSLNGMERRLLVHILSFAGLMYQKSSLTEEQKLDELNRNFRTESFRQLVRDVKPRGVKEKIAVFLLKHEWIRMYHELCRLVYRKR